MDVRQLRYFITIARCGSFSRAANELNVAQPALSHHVANLEGELGVRLFDRSTKGVVPTECGQTLISHAETIIHQLNLAARDVRNKSENPSGEVTIGLPSSISLALTVPLLAEAEKRFPKVELKVSENYSGYLVDWLAAGRLDLALLFDIDSQLQFETIHLFSDMLYFVGSPDQLPSGRDIEFRQVAQHPLILTGESHGLRHVIDRTSQSGSVDINVKTELDSLVAIKRLAAAGYGYTVLPWYAIREEVEAGQLGALKIVEPVLQRDVFLARSGEWAPTRATEQISDLVVELTKRLVNADHWLESTVTA